jgi:hypothetical protein
LPAASFRDREEHRWQNLRTHRRFPARQALAAAIGSVATLKGELAAAEDAAQRAKRNKWDATTALEALEAEPPQREDLAGQYISALASGDDIATLAPPHKEAVTTNLEREVEHWAKVQTACETAAKDLSGSLEYAQSRLEGAADEVIRSESSLVAKLIVEVERQQAWLVERRVTLRYFASNNLIADEALRDRVRALMKADLPVPTDMGSFAHGIFDAHPANLKLSAVREALKADAGAPLLGEEN